MYTSHKDSAVSSPCVCTTVKKLSRILGRAYDSALASSGINVTQFAVMRCIARHGGEPLARVAEELEMDRTSLYRAITPMERGGWIELGAGINARSRSASITRKGTVALARAEEEWDRLQRNLLKTYGKTEWNILAVELRRLGDCAERLTKV